MKKVFEVLMFAAACAVLPVITGCDSEKKPDKPKEDGKTPLEQVAEAYTQPVQVASPAVHTPPAAPRAPRRDPAAQRAARRGPAKSADCRNYLKQIGNAMMMYCNDNNDNYPKNLSELRSYGISDKLLRCEPGQRSNYKYLRPRRNASSGTVVVRCEKHGLALFADESVRNAR